MPQKILEEIVAMAAKSGITEQDLRYQTSYQPGQLRFNTAPNKIGFKIFIDQRISDAPISKSERIATIDIASLGQIIPVNILVSYGKEAAEDSVAYVKYDVRSSEAAGDITITKAKFETKINDPLAIDALGIEGDGPSGSDFLRKMFAHYARHMIKNAN